MRRRPRSLGVVAVAAVAGLALASCGIPTQPSASPIAAGQIQPTLPVTQPTASPCTKSGCTKVTVFFVTSAGRLRAYQRVVPTPPKIGTVIGALLVGPTTKERATGTQTALGSGIRLTSVQQTPNRKTVTLNFNGRFGTLSGARERLGVAQVVYTVTAVKPDVGVIFEIDNAQTEVPLETGFLWTGPVHEAQYATLLTPTTTTTTTSPTTTP
ncbi:MAG TPA: GerMN domain-containing protein [Acidimicrobiales bacterium]|nr:GerMN domain-containing protein [Acidimicrobiales bacterium]